MVRVILIALLGFVIISCFPSAYYRLADGRKVIKSKYKNIKYFDANILNEIDVNYLYKKLIIIWLIKIIKSYEMLEKM